MEVQDKEWVRYGAARPRLEGHPVQEYLDSIELGSESDSDWMEDDTEGDDDPEEEWPRAVDEGRLTTRDQALKGLEQARNFMDANPECMAHFEGGCGGATVALIGMRRGFEGCLEPMGQRQATLPELTAKAEEARMRRVGHEKLDKLDKAQLVFVLEIMRDLNVR